MRVMLTSTHIYLGAMNAYVSILILIQLRYALAVSFKRYKTKNCTD